MTLVRLALQTLVVFSMVGFVSVSNYARPRSSAAPAGDNGGRAGAQSAATAAGHAAGSRFGPEVGYGSMSLRRVTAARSGAPGLTDKLTDPWIDNRRERPSPAVLTLGGRVNGIVGQARTTLNAPVPFARLVLRDPGTGRIEARAVADDKGQFTFLDIMPSGYVVELIGPNDSVFATSEVVTVGLGELREAVVNLADPRQALGTFGTLASSADEPIAVARQTGVNAVAAPERSISPQR